MTSKGAMKWALAAFVLVVLVAGSRIASARVYQGSGSRAVNLSSPEAQSPEKNKQEEDQNEAYKHSSTVKALGGLLGLNVDEAATLFEVANFVVLALLLGWFLARSLPKTFRGRNTAIQKHLVDARTATEEANARISSVEQRLGKLDEQIAGIKEQAEKDLAADERRLRDALEEEKSRILAGADQEIASATAHAQRLLQEFAAELAIEQAARQLVVTEEMDRVLVRNFAQSFEISRSKDGVS